MMVAQFRSGYARHLSEPAWASMVSRLCAVSSEFAGLWARHDVAAPSSRIKLWVQNLSGRTLQTSAASFAVGGVPETRMVAYTPVTETDRATLTEFTANPPGITRCPAHTRAEAA
jgi:hypothetical protein